VADDGGEVVCAAAVPASANVKTAAKTYCADRMTCFSFGRSERQDRLQEIGTFDGENCLGPSAGNRTWSPRTTGRDFVDGDRHVGHDRDVIARNFDEALADHEELVATVFPNDHFAWTHARHQRDVGWIDPNLPLDGRQCHHLHVGRICGLARGDDFEP
jgi:hypothetical protein